MQYFLFALLATFALLGLESDPPLPDLKAFPHVSTMVVPNENNPLFGMYHIYADPTAMPALQAGKGGYPPGATFVGKRYQLLKLPAGYCLPGKLQGYIMMYRAPDDSRAKDTGGWIFRQFDASGRPKMTNGKDCFSCHQAHPETGFVLSRPLE